MARLIVAMLILGLGTAGLMAGSPKPELPKDTLPAELAIDRIPLGLDKDRQIPADNPLTAAKVQLGRKLFFDPILSADGSVSCASCHRPERGFSGPDRLALGINNQRTTRNAPSLLNRAYGKSFFWDGREKSLEAQALKPIENPVEMGASVAKAVERLQASKDYRRLFKEAFNGPPSASQLGKALASFERALLLGDSRVDRFRAGQISHLNEKERHGLWLFESRARCWRCHVGPNFTDEEFHNTGVGWGKEPADLGRFVVTKKDADRGRFKTPTLRGLTATAPYMHDGSIATLEGVVEFYNKGGGQNPILDKEIQPLNLDKEEVEALVAFLQALSNK